MGIPTDIFSLFEVTLPQRKTSFLLTRVRRREFANWSQADEDGADTRAAEDEQALIAAWLERHGEIPGKCPAVKLGEMQAPPAGGLVEKAQVGADLEIWVAD